MSNSLKHFFVPGCAALASVLMNGCNSSSLTFDATPNTGGNHSSLTSDPNLGPSPTPSSTPTPLPSNVSGAPTILYIDALSGPIAGGENNLGAYLSIFGKNFGSNLGAIQVKIGGALVANYRSLTPSVAYAKNGISQVTVQVGSIGHPTLGTALPVTICVSGVCSANNPAATFTPNSGRIFFVSQSGSDATAVIGDINHPFRTLQGTSPSGDCSGPSNDQSVYSKLQAGDHVVIRGGYWSDIGRSHAWLRFCASNSAIGSGATVANAGGVNGSAGKWIHFTAYPGEVVSYTTPANMSAAFQGAEGAASGYTGMYISFSNFKIQVDKNAAGDAAPMNEQYGSGPWRVVNNELGPWPSVVDARAGGYSGKGSGTRVFGNYVHDIRRICDGVNANNAADMAQCPNGQPVIVNGEELLNHGFYLDAGGGDMEIAYNWVTNVLEGNLIQTYASHGGGSLTDLLIHHNWFENSGKYGINISDGTHSARVWSNVVIGASLSGVRINVGYDSGIDMEIFNNTFYNNARTQTCQSETTWNAGLTGSNNATITNNVFVAGPDTTQNDNLYCHNDNDGYVNFGTNLIWDARGTSGISTWTPNSGSTTLVHDPLFNNLASFDFSLKPSSPAIGVGVAIPDYSSFYDYTTLFVRNSTAGINLGAY